MGSVDHESDLMLLDGRPHELMRHRSRQTLAVDEIDSLLVTFGRVIVVFA